MNALELVTITILTASRRGQKIEINFVGWPTQRDLLKAIELEVIRVTAEAEKEAKDMGIPVSDVLRAGEIEEYGLATQIIQTCPIQQYVDGGPIAVLFAEVQIGTIRMNKHVIYQS